MANKLRTLRQTFDTDGTTNAKPDLSGITHEIRSIMFVPVTADSMEMNSNPGTDDWVEVGAEKVYNYPQNIDDLPSFRGKSASEDLDIHVEIKLY